jgi:signal transduction histidine kinase
MSATRTTIAGIPNSALAVEATAYFVVAEALTNVAKHSHAHRATVVARVEDGTLELRVRDDGVGGAGGARPDGGGYDLPREHPGLA